MAVGYSCYQQHLLHNLKKKCNGFPQNQGKKYFLEIYCLIYLFGWPSLLILVSSYYNYMKNCEHLFDFKSHSSSHFPIHYLYEDLSFCKGRKDLFLSVQTGLRYCCCCVTLQRAISKVFFFILNLQDPSIKMWFNSGFFSLAVKDLLGDWQGKTKINETSKHQNNLFEKISEQVVITLKNRSGKFLKVMSISDDTTNWWVNNIYFYKYIVN